MAEKGLTPKQRREIRRQQKQAHAEEKKARLLVAPSVDQKPRIGAPPPEDAKIPRRNADPGSILDRKMTFTREHQDVTDEWPWGPRDCLLREWDEKIRPFLSEMERLTWNEIAKQRVNQRIKHHDQDVTSLCNEAQRRWSEISIQHDTAFRFRLGNKPRLWGFRLSEVFHIVWWDPQHQIYPTEP